MCIRDSPSLGVAVQWAVAKLLFIRKLHAAMGLDRLRYFVCGGAALPPETAWFMLSLGLNILEGYGLTESSPVISVNRPKQFRIGTVGLPLKGVEVRISEAGEILARGPNVMRGYYRRPEDTAEAIDADGLSLIHIFPGSFHCFAYGKKELRGVLSKLSAW